MKFNLFLSPTLIDFKTSRDLRRVTENIIQELRLSHAGHANLSVDSISKAC